MSNAAVARAVRWVRSQVRGVPAPTLIWTILACSATICFLRASRKTKTNAREAASARAKNASESVTAQPEVSNEQMEEEEEEVKEEEEEEENGDVSDGLDDDVETYGDDDEEVVEEEEEENGNVIDG